MKRIQTSKKMTVLAVSGLVAITVIAAFASISSTTTAFAVKDTRCAKHTQGGGNPHDTENPTNPHDTQLGYNTGNPHDACVGS